MKKENKICFFSFIAIIIVFFLIVSCKKDKLAVLTTSEITQITQTSATCGGNITDDGGADITARGVCWSIDQNPTISDVKTTDGSGKSSFTSLLKNLTLNTTYYVRAYATNKAGTAYGELKKFQSLLGNGITVTDIDGNVYNTVTIGTQVWMAENLNVTHYVNGELIPIVSDSATWSNLENGAYSDYKNIPENSIIYGKLYNWYAIADNRSLAPAGWHVATDVEWTTLSIFLGSNGGGKMKESGTSHWYYPNTGATDESGFTGLPGGFRDIESDFYNNSFGGYWWSPTGDTNYNSWCRFLIYNTPFLSRYCVYENYGLSVRCIKD